MSVSDGDSISAKGIWLEVRILRYDGLLLL